MVSFLQFAVVNQHLEIHFPSSGRPFCSNNATTESFIEGQQICYTHDFFSSKIGFVLAVWVCWLVRSLVGWLVGWL